MIINEFWILDRKTKEIIAKKRTRGKKIEYAGALYTIEGYEDQYIFRTSLWMFKKRVYLFLEGYSFPISFEKLEIDAHKLKTIITTLSYNLAYLQIEAYLKLILIMVIVGLIVSAGVGYFLYDYLQKTLVKKIVEAIISSRAIPMK